jgi:hypothetical protein
MGYYDNKVPGEVKPDPAYLAEVMLLWVADLQAELKKAGRQVDRLERKILRRSQSLGEARAGEREATRLFCDALAANANLPINGGW